MNRIGLVGIVAFVLAVVACHDSPASPAEGLAPGSFKASISGDHTFDRTGDAVAANVNSRMVAILMGTHPLGGLAPDTTVNLDLASPPGLAVGAYPVGDFEHDGVAAGGVFILGTGSATDASYVSIPGSGTIEITRKSGTGVQGRFSFLAEGAVIQGDPVTELDTIRVSGQFNARY